MHLIDDVNSLSEDTIEDIERLTLRWVFQAVHDFSYQAHDIFRESPDEVQDIAEDITREVLDRLAGYNVGQRLLGNVDYRRARYIILPDQIIRQALFADSKAEKSSSSATMQMSQVSLSVRQQRAGQTIDNVGKLPQSLTLGGSSFLSTVVLLHYRYAHHDTHNLEQVTICAVPNGRLQARYNPTPEDSIWLAGRDAPTLGEDFRVRLSFARLAAKRTWRVQRIRYNPSGKTVSADWQE